MGKLFFLLLFFNAGQPKVCHRFIQLVYLVSGCTEEFCSQCDQLGHLRESCTLKVQCNLCGLQGHTFCSCLQSYASRLHASVCECGDVAPGSSVVVPVPAVSSAVREDEG